MCHVQFQRVNTCDNERALPQLKHVLVNTPVLAYQSSPTRHWWVCMLSICIICMAIRSWYKHIIVTLYAGCSSLNN